MTRRALWAARSALLVVGASLLAPAPAPAQTVRGRVVEAVTETAVPGATVRLLDGQGRSVASGMAGSEGAFVLVAPGAADYTVTVEHLAYAPFSLGPFALDDEEGSELLLRLTIRVIPLTPVSVEVDANVRKLERAGFYERRRLGIGTFLEREQIEAGRARTAGELLRRVSGLRLIVQGYFTDVQTRGGGCRPGIYIDGALVSGPRRTVTSFNLEDLPAPDLEAVEVYPGAAGVPPQYNGAGMSGCGLILFWTRKPGT